MLLQSFKKERIFLEGTNSHPEFSSIVSVKSMVNDTNLYQTQMVLFDYE